MKTILQANILSWLVLTLNLQAGVSFWDGNVATPGAGATPAGTWGVDAFWSSDINGTVSTTAWTLGDTAIFCAGDDATDSFTVSVSGTQSVAGIVFEEGAVTLSGGALLPTAFPFLVAVTSNATINSAIIGTRPLTKTGLGTLTLTGTNTYTGLTTIREGVVAISNPNALGSTAAGTVVSNDATLEISGDIALNEPLTVFGRGLGNDGAIRSMSGSNWISAIQMDPDMSQRSLIYTPAGILTLGRVDAGSRFFLIVAGAGQTVISGQSPSHGLYWPGAAGGISVRDRATLTINGFVNIRGIIFVEHQSTLRMGNHHRFGNPGNAYPSMVLDGVFDLNGFTNTLDGLRGPGTIINSGSSTLVMGVGASGQVYPIFQGVIRGNTTVVKEGPSIQGFVGHNTYTGDTFVNAGHLNVYSGGSMSNSPTIQVAPGALLSAYASPLTIVPNQLLTGNGILDGEFILAAGARIRPGTGLGSMRLSRYSYSGLDLSAGGILDWELATLSVNAPGTNYGSIINEGQGTVTLDGASRLRLHFTGSATPPDPSHPFWQETRTWNLIASTNTLSNFAVIENGTFPAGNFTTSVASDGVWLTFTPNDTTPPVILCPPDQTNEWVTGSVPVFDIPSVWDNFDTNPALTFVDAELPATCPAVRIFRRIWTATDDATNSASCSQTITFVDTTPPVIICAPDQTNLWTSGGVPVFDVPTFSDDCDTNLTVTFVDSEVPASCPVARIFRRVWTATDDCTNRASCSQAITFVTQPPVATIQLSPLATFTGVTNLIVIAVNNSNACVTLDGSGSSDADLDPLTYSWLVDGLFTTSLTPGQEPGGGGTGSGGGTVTLAGNSLALDVAFSGLSANVNAAHIHGPAPLGVNASVLYPLNPITTPGSTAGTINGLVPLTEPTGGFALAQQLEQLLDGLWYINLHTPLHPGGEIRGQILGTQSGAVVTNCLALGSHQVCLTVSDGVCADTACVTVDVISPAESLGLLIEKIENSNLARNSKRPLIASLRVAGESFEAGRLNSGANQLGAFQNKVRAQVADAALADCLIQDAQVIIDAVGGH